MSLNKEKRCHEISEHQTTFCEKTAGLASEIKRGKIVSSLHPNKYLSSKTWSLMKVNDTRQYTRPIF
jgi:hypothetical protein